MEKQILNTGDEAAKYVTNIEGWVDCNGRFWGKDEQAARWSGCTHIACRNCGKPTPKNYTICEDCREKKDIERYEKKDRKQWDGETPLYSEFIDKYFFDGDDLLDYLYVTEKSSESLRLVICCPIYLSQITEDGFYDDLPEDGELPEDVVKAIDALNDVIREQEPVSWSPGRYAAEIDVADRRRT